MIQTTPYAIFDLDGTLIDSMPYWKNLGSDYLMANGRVPEPDLDRILAAMSMTESSRYLLEHYHLPGTTASVAQGLNDQMKEYYASRIPVKPGAASYLEELHRQGITMAICSSGSPEMIRLALTRLNLLSYFPIIVSCNETGKGKESPLSYQLTLQRLGAEPSDCTIYEDAFFAMQTARQLGCRIVGVYDESCSEPEEVIRDFCDAYITDFRMLNY